MKTEETRKNKRWSRLEDLMLLSYPNTDASVMAQRLDRTEPSIWSRRQLLQGAKKDKTPKAHAYRLSLLNELNKGQLEMDLTPPPAPKPQPVMPTRVIPIRSDREMLADYQKERKRYKEDFTKELNAIRKSPAVKPITLGAPKRRTLRARFLAWLQRG